MPVARGVLYVATIAGVAWAIKALLTGPPPLGLALGAFGGYLLLVVGGVVLSRFGMFADVIARGPRGARGVALTFDDGPDPATTPKVLELLEQAGAKAVFFVIGEKAERYPELLRDIIARGHGIGLHGYQHDWWLSLRTSRRVREDLEQGRRALVELLGQPPTLYRAPVGHVSPVMARVLDEMDLQVVGWTVKSLDGWSGTLPERVVARVLPQLRDGAIVLLHDASERSTFEPASIEALPEIIEVARRRGLELVRVDDWLPSDGPASLSRSGQGATSPSARSGSSS